MVILSMVTQAVKSGMESDELSHKFKVGIVIINKSWSSLLESVKLTQQNNRMLYPKGKTGKDKIQGLEVENDVSVKGV